MFNPTMSFAPSSSGALVARATLGEIKRQKLKRPWTEQVTAEMNNAEEEWRRNRVRCQAYGEGTRTGVRPDLGPFASLLPTQLAGIADYLQPADRAKFFAASCGLIVSI
jgi:hypothetical protein